MGVPQFLAAVLQSAGRPIDLRHYANGIPLDPHHENHRFHPHGRRPLRIGVDVSGWIYQACMGHCDMLADERHLSNYGRAVLWQAQATGTNSVVQDVEVALTYTTKCAQYVLKRVQSLITTCDAQVLVVLDGATPPIKQKECQKRSRKRKEMEKDRDESVDPSGDAQNEEKRLRAFRRAGAGDHYPTIVASVIDALRENGIDFLVAPYEADGQLAFLSWQKYIDLVVTEDSDLIAYGASPILYKLAKDEPTGILIRREDLSSNPVDYDFTDWSPVMLAVLFVALGSDYCKKLRGVGMKTAYKVVQAAFLNRNDSSASPLAVFIRKIIAESWDRDMTEEVKNEFEDLFLKGLYAFRHPVIYDPFEQTCRSVDDPDSGGDPELISYEPYLKLCRNIEQREQSAGAPFDRQISFFIAIGWISPRTKLPYRDAGLPDQIRTILENLTTAAPKALCGQGSPCDETIIIDEIEKALPDEENSSEDDLADDTIMFESQLYAPVPNNSKLSVCPDNHTSAVKIADYDKKMQQSKADNSIALNSVVQNEIIEILDDSDEDFLHNQSENLFEPNEKNTASKEYNF